MKICAISDLHGHLPTDLPKSDILLIGGDICPATDHNVWFQEKWVKRDFLYWCYWINHSVKHSKYIVFIAGNHDFFFENLMKEKLEDEYRISLSRNVFYLRDSSVEIEGITIYGSPWSNKFYNWAFMKEDKNLAYQYKKIPDKVDILLTHGPAYGYGDIILDIVGETENLGSRSLTNAINKRDIKYVFSGHIHSGNHELVSNNETRFACVSLLDEEYKPTNKPLIIEV